jgi:orotate phosphoribosyltransferase
LNTQEEKLIKWLFRTRAIKVCPENKPFFYTSGAIGPYYINTHFLYGSEKKANALLSVINIEKDNTASCPDKLTELVKENYKRTPIYRQLIDGICEYIRANINIDEVDYISGGERRDWYFSLMTAYLLQKPHLSIFKDLSVVASEKRGTVMKRVLKDKRVFHIADLINEASSYERAWIPAIADRGGKLGWSISIVDRQQGGAQILENAGIKSFSLIKVDKKLFKNSMAMGEITFEQYTMLIDYIDDPEGSMKEFLKDNPEFLLNTMKDSDKKTRERAILCKEKYEL